MASKGYKERGPNTPLNDCNNAVTEYCPACCVRTSIVEMLETEASGENCDREHIALTPDCSQSSA